MMQACSCPAPMGYHTVTCASRQPRMMITSHAALCLARAALESRAASYPATSNETHLYREAMAVIDAINAQGGCDMYEPAARDGRLTSLIDVIVNG